MMYSFLSHHGIAGQKWGKRNGPPYPLGISDHSASERKAGWQKSLDKPTKSSNIKNSSGKDEQSNEKRGLTRVFPKERFGRVSSIKKWYLFVIFLPNPLEGTMDAIYSVDKQTGEFRDFPYMKEEIFEEVMNLLGKASSFRTMS